MEALDQLILEYLRSCRYQKHLDPKTLKSYWIDLTQFSSFLHGDTSIVDKQKINNYVAPLDRHYGVKTVKRIFASLMVLFIVLLYHVSSKANSDYCYLAFSKSTSTGYKQL